MHCPCELLIQQEIQRLLLVMQGGSEESAALQAVMQLPELVVQALAHALDYVRPLHMEAVLRYGASFKPFHGAHQMSLSPNALRYGMQA